MTAPSLNSSQMSGAFYAPMVYDPGTGLYAPISSTNPLPTTATFSGTLAEGVADGADVTQGAIADAAVAAGAAGTLSAKLRRMTTDIGALLTRWPAALGQGTAAQSIPVVLSSDGPFATNFGVQADAAATSDTGSFSFIAFVKRLLSVYFSAPSNAATTAYAASLIVKSAAGTLVGLSGYNSKTSTQFLQIHDAAALPADAAVPKVVLAVPASSPFSLDFGPRGRAFASGIVICNSSTGPTKTIGSADLWLDAQYL